MERHTTDDDIQQRGAIDGSGSRESDSHRGHCKCDGVQSCAWRRNIRCADLYNQLRCVWSYNLRVQSEFRDRRWIGIPVVRSWNEFHSESLR